MGLFIDQNQSPSQFLERRLALLYGINSMSLKALDLVKEEMCVGKGFRRDNGTDYYNHCVDVANTLISFQIVGEDVICAALLHDIIEDVEGYRRVTIAKMFNENVARLVMLVTKKEGIDYKQPEAIQEYLEEISGYAEIVILGVSLAGDAEHLAKALERLRKAKVKVTWSPALVTLYPISSL